MTLHLRSSKLQKFEFLQKMSSDPHHLSMVSLETDLVDESQDSKVPDIEIPEVQPLPPQVGTFITVVNLINTLLGSGIIAVPNSFHSQGIVPSLILLILIAFLSHLTTCIIFKLQIKFKADGYDSLVFQILGKAGQVIYSIFSLLFLLPNMIAYLIIGGDIITSWFEKANIDLKPLGWHALMIFIYSFLLPIPITIPKGIKIISFFSFITFICMFLYIAVMFYEIHRYFGQHRITKTTYSIARWDFYFFSAISVFSESFNLPSVALPIVYNYEEHYQSRRKVSAITMILAFIFVFIPSVIGYCIFGEDTNQNILLNFDSNDIAFLFVRIAFFIIVNSSFPVVARSVEATWGEFFFKINNPEFLYGWRRAVILIVTCGIPLIVAMLLPKAKAAIAIGSASGGFIVAFVFPAILYLKTTRKPMKHPICVGCIILAIIGIGLSCVSTYASVLEAVHYYQNN